MEIIFWFSVLLIFYTYFGYPFFLKILSLFIAKNVNTSSITPLVTFIITAYNEEAQIKEKIENTLLLDYPKDKLQIIVASDASTDATDAIVEKYKYNGIELVRSNQRKGKESAQKYGLERARGDIVVFSDVATNLSANALRNIVSNFNDPTIGCVSSTDRFIDKNGKLSGEGAYVKYEMILRALESKINSIVGLSGSYFATRKEVCNNWNANLQSDFNTVLNSIKMGMRGISDPNSVGYYNDIANEKKEFERKVRTVLRGITVLMSNLTFLNPLDYGMFSWQLFSHKLCRWLVPLFLIIAFISNFILIFYSSFYSLIFLIQVGFYCIGFFFKKSQVSWLKLPNYFVNVNKAILSAWIKYFRGTRYLYWTPSER